MRVPWSAAPKPATLVSAQDPIDVIGTARRWVSRSGQKLDGALDAFAIDVAGVRAIDVGASTGGFTDCLLQRGARHVTALDVGYGQLHWSIRQDERVTVIERTNIRTADPASIGAPFDLVVADLSFISLRTVAPALDALGSETCQWVLLIKPQFEVGRESVARGGIVRDDRARISAVEAVLAAFDDRGLGCQGLAVSSITGATGNIEYVAHFVRRARTVALDDVMRLSEEAS